MSCNNELLNAFKTCGNQVPGVESAWVTNRKNIATAPHADGSNLVTDMTMVTGKYIYPLELNTETIKPKSELVISTTGSNRYKHGAELSVITPTGADILNIMGDDLVLIVKLKNKADIAGGGTFQIYGLECGLRSENGIVIDPLAASVMLKYASRGNETEFYPVWNLWKTSDALTLTMLDLFLVP